MRRREIRYQTKSRLALPAISPGNAVRYRIFPEIRTMGRKAASPLRMKRTPQ
jgi:hypothetical protein